VTWIAVDTVKRPQQLISGVGYLCFIFILFITSKYPDRVRRTMKITHVLAIFFNETKFDLQEMLIIWYVLDTLKYLQKIC